MLQRKGMKGTERMPFDPMWVLLNCQSSTKDVLGVIVHFGLDPRCMHDDQPPPLGRAIASEQPLYFSSELRINGRKAVDVAQWK